MSDQQVTVSTVRYLSQDRVIDRGNLHKMEEEHHSKNGYWVELNTQAKEEVHWLKNKLKKKRSEKRLEIIRECKPSLDPKELPETLKSYLDAKAHHRNISSKLEAKKAEARLNAMSYPMKTATGKAKDPTSAEIDARIKSDGDVITLTEQFNEASTELEILEAKGYQNVKNKEPTVDDINAMIDNDEAISKLTEELLEAEAAQIKYQAAVDEMRGVKQSISNLITLWCNHYWDDPKAVVQQRKLEQE